MRMSAMRHGCRHTATLRKAQLEVEQRGATINCASARQPATSAWGDVEEIMALAAVAPNGVIYCCSRTSNILECIELHIDAHHGQMVTSRHAGDVRVIDFKPHDTILLFDGSCHWDCYVPAAPIPLMRPTGRGGRD